MTALAHPTDQAASQPLHIALVGNPNCGKTALFNRLTGSRQKVANYAGVTVERKEGRYQAPSGRIIRVLDLPGAYSLHPTSPDEAVTRAVCLGELPGESQPELLVCVVDATNLRLHLRFALEVKALGRPMLLVLNMMDAAAKRGVRIDRSRLSAELGMPVVESVAVHRDGARALIELIDNGRPARRNLPPAARGRANAAGGDPPRRCHRPHRAAPGDRPSAAGRPAVHDVPGRVCMGCSGDGSDQSADGAVGHLGGHPTA